MSERNEKLQDAVEQGFDIVQKRFDWCTENLKRLEDRVDVMGDEVFPCWDEKK
jgi:hypothetical protein